MIVWINGSFGSGKTSTAMMLKNQHEKFEVFDPEETGFYIRDNLPKELLQDDFQNIHLFRMFNFEMLKYMCENTDKIIIVPMTIVDEGYYDEIITRLRETNIKVVHFTLMARRETLLDRLNKRDDGSFEWASRQVDRCIEALSKQKFENKIMTDNDRIESSVDYIMTNLKTNKYL